MLEKVIENWTSRLDYIRASRGSPMPEIIFKISPLPHASALIQRDFGRVLGIQQTKQLPHVAKVDLVWQLGGGNLGQSLSNHGPHVFYRRKIWRVSRPGKQFNLVIDEEPLDIACHVWSRIILLKYGCGQALKVRKDNWLQHLGDVALAV
ncbi:uncharacterized protein TNCV_4248311 [Trichonephila clavipes]|nr:uncharacterized protein TNCV_4248311 [Trichonephila clavipes]